MRRTWRMIYSSERDQARWQLLRVPLICPGVPTSRPGGIQCLRDVDCGASGRSVPVAWLHLPPDGRCRRYPGSRSLSALEPCWSAYHLSFTQDLLNPLYTIMFSTWLALYTMDSFTNLRKSIPLGPVSPFHIVFNGERMCDAAAEHLMATQQTKL